MSKVPMPDLLLSCLARASVDMTSGHVMDKSGDSNVAPSPIGVPGKTVAVPAMATPCRD